jgi:hypothetical protein
MSGICKPPATKRSVPPARPARSSQGLTAWKTMQKRYDKGELDPKVN